MWPIVDSLVLVWGIALLLYGFWVGGVILAWRAAGVVIVVLVASQVADPVAAWILPEAVREESVGRLVVFLLLMGLCWWVVGLTGTLLQKIVDIVTWIPFTSTINRLAGVLLSAGLCIGASAAVYAFSPSWGWLPAWIVDRLQNAWTLKTAAALWNTTAWLFPVLREWLQMLWNLLPL